MNTFVLCCRASVLIVFRYYLLETLVREFERILCEAIRTPSINDADCFVFGPSQCLHSFDPLITSKSTAGSLLSPALGVRLAVLHFLEALLGDTVYHFCSFRPYLASNKDGEPSEEYILFEADAFLDTRKELGCRDLFRQCFQTEVRSINQPKCAGSAKTKDCFSVQVFQDFLVAQHQKFVSIGSSVDLAL